MIKAVIFDMDGVIVESERAQIEAERQTLLKYGVRISCKKLQQYTGTTAEFMFNELIKEYRLNVAIEKMLNEKEKILFKLLEKDARPTRGIIRLIKTLRRKRIKLGIASSSNKKLIGHVLRKLNIMQLFNSVVGSDDVAHSKPNPEIFLEAAKRLRVSPANCLVIEDSKLGVEAAKNARMKCVGYKNPNSGHQDLAKADIIIHDFSKLDVEKLLSL